jgi:hypothetical protein
MFEVHENFEVDFAGRIKGGLRAGELRAASTLTDG